MYDYYDSNGRMVWENFIFQFVDALCVHCSQNVTHLQYVQNVPCEIFVSGFRRLMLEERYNRL